MQWTFLFLFLSLTSVSLSLENAKDAQAVEFTLQSSKTQYSDAISPQVYVFDRSLGAYQLSSSEFPARATPKIAQFRTTVDSAFNKFFAKMEENGVLSLQREASSASISSEETKGFGMLVTLEKGSSASEALLNFSFALPQILGTSSAEPLRARISLSMTQGDWDDYERGMDIELSTLGKSENELQAYFKKCSSFLTPLMSSASKAFFGMFQEDGIMVTVGDVRQVETPQTLHSGAFVPSRFVANQNEIQHFLGTSLSEVVFEVPLSLTDTDYEKLAREIEQAELDDAKLQKELAELAEERKQRDIENEPTLRKQVKSLIDGYKTTISPKDLARSEVKQALKDLTAIYDQSVILPPTELTDRKKIMACTDVLGPFMISAQRNILSRRKTQLNFSKFIGLISATDFSEQMAKLTHAEEMLTFQEELAQIRF